MDNGKFPKELLKHYEQYGEGIRKALQGFKDVEPESYFYELCYCLCTPQSKALHAEIVVSKLKLLDFLHKDVEVKALLRDKEHYIRFHNEKAKSLVKARDEWEAINDILVSDCDAKVKRGKLVKAVRGLGMKEASHFLRNIGVFGLAIIDRHVLKHLVSCGVFLELPKIQSIKDYEYVERLWFDYCADVGIRQEEMDLIFWSYETGFILK